MYYLIFLIHRPHENLDMAVAGVPNGDVPPDDGLHGGPAVGGHGREAEVGAALAVAEALYVQKRLEAKIYVHKIF